MILLPVLGRDLACRIDWNEISVLESEPVLQDGILNFFRHALRFKEVDQLRGKMPNPRDTDFFVVRQFFP